MKAWLQLQLLATTFHVLVCVNGEYLHLVTVGDDLVCLNTKNITADTRRPLVKRASLNKYSRPAAVEDTLNSIRRLKSNVANMHYVVRK